MGNGRARVDLFAVAGSGWGEEPEVEELAHPWPDAVQGLRIDVMIVNWRKSVGRRSHWMDRVRTTTRFAPDCFSGSWALARLPAPNKRNQQTNYRYNNIKPRETRKGAMSSVFISTILLVGFLYDVSAFRRVIFFSALINRDYLLSSWETNIPVVWRSGLAGPVLSVSRYVLPVLLGLVCILLIHSLSLGWGPHRIGIRPLQWAATAANLSLMHGASSFLWRAGKAWRWRSPLRAVSLLG